MREFLLFNRVARQMPRLLLFTYSECNPLSSQEHTIDSLTAFSKYGPSKLVYAQ